RARHGRRPGARARSRLRRLRNQTSRNAAPAGKNRAVFKFRIQIQHTNVNMIETLTSSSSKKISFGEVVPNAPARILVVDDNESNRDVLLRRLRRQEYSVETASDGL